MQVCQNGWSRKKFGVNLMLIVTCQHKQGLKILVLIMRSERFLECWCNTQMSSSKAENRSWKQKSFNGWPPQRDLAAFLVNYPEVLRGDSQCVCWLQNNDLITEKKKDTPSSKQTHPGPHRQTFSRPCTTIFKKRYRKTLKQRQWCIETTISMKGYK